MKSDYNYEHLSVCVEEAPDEEEVQEAEDMVSAAIMAAVLEERQKEQKHCPTCTCSLGDGRGRTVATSEGRADKNNTDHHTNTNTNEQQQQQRYVNNTALGRNSKGSITTHHSGDLGNNSQSTSIASVRQAAAKGKDSNLITLTNSPVVTYSLRDDCSVEVHEDNSKHTTSKATSSPLTDLDIINNDTQPSSCKAVSTKMKVIELTSLNITEHFNSDNLSELSAVDKCICGRSYSLGTNAIDVGTQTVPSYIGESGKVHSTCIYCKGHKIKDRQHHRENCKKVQRSKELLLLGITDSSNKLSVSSDSESVSMARAGDTSVCADDGKKRGASLPSSAGITDIGGGPHHDLEELPSMSPVLGSSCSWEWASQMGVPADSGSPSTPSSFTSIAASTSYESELSSAPSPLHGPGLTSNRHQQCSSNREKPPLRLLPSPTASTYSSASPSTDLPTLSDTSGESSLSLVNTTTTTNNNNNSNNSNSDVANIRDLIQFSSSPTKKYSRSEKTDVYAHLPPDNSKIVKRSQHSSGFPSYEEALRRKQVGSLLDSDNNLLTSSISTMTARSSCSSTDMPLNNINSSSVNMSSEESCDTSNSLEVSAELLARLTSSVNSFDLTVIDSYNDSSKSRKHINNNSNNINSSLAQHRSGSNNDVDQRVTGDRKGSIGGGGGTIGVVCQQYPAQCVRSPLCISPAIHRPAPKCAGEWRVVASTVTASTTVTPI